MSNWYVSQSLTFESDKITIDGVGDEVMMDWEHSIMSASAAYVTEGGGDILEVGFGMGISAGYIQSHSISSHTIIENHPQIVEKLETWIQNIEEEMTQVQTEISEIDDKGYFESDDEVGEKFNQISQVIKNIQTLRGEDATNDTTE